MNPITTLCRQLRNNQTPAEIKLWDMIRKRSIGGYKFLRQYPLVVSQVDRKYFYIADFYCVKLKLIIEIDGPVHLFKKQYDANRDLILQDLGCSILRFKNDEVLSQVDVVLDIISSKIANIVT